MYIIKKSNLNTQRKTNDSV